MQTEQVRQKKPVSEITVDDLPDINAVLAREDTVQIVPGKNGTAKIIHIKRKIVKTTQGIDCVKS